MNAFTLLAAITVLALVGSVASSSDIPIEPGTASVADSAFYVAAEEWPVYNGTPSSSHFSSLHKINRENVAGLTKVWEYRSGDGPAKVWYEFNPLIVDGLMYVATGGGALAALDPASGQELWKFKPAGPAYPSRGASFWRDPQKPGQASVFFLSGSVAQDGNSDLYAVDARTGKVIADFGDNGRIPMSVPVSSPGVIYKDLIILGSAQGKRGKGQIRAYDVRSGRMRWVFHTIPKRGDPGSDTWGGVGPEKATGANCWGGMTIDERRGIVYVATAQPKNSSKGVDFFSGDWPGRNRFSSSVIALKADTGVLVWDFQETHHDIWDFDIPAPPNLVRIRFKGKQVDAVAQVTKRGNTLLLDRDTGALFYPAQERPAPPSDVPAERAYPTQRVVTIPEPFAKTQFTEEDVTNLNPEARAYILERFKLARTGWFDPPSLQGTIYFGVQGGAQWGGAAYDPETHLLYVNSNHVPWFVKMRKSVTGDSIIGGSAPLDTAQRVTQIKQGQAHYVQYCAGCHGIERKGEGGGPPLRLLPIQYLEEDIVDISVKGRGRMPPVTAALDPEVPRAIAAYLWNVDRDVLRLYQSETDTDYQPAYITEPRGRGSLRDQQGFPGSKPPWGTLNAINLDTGKIQWRVPLGEYPELQARGIPPTGTPNFGGSVVTAGGLLFIAATADQKMRAFDKSTGEILWEAQLPFGAYATPATYAIAGRQYVVIAAGGGQNGALAGDAYVAFALP